MSNFSEALKSIIKNSNKSIYSISKSTNLERTAIQRAITGNRLPSWEFIETLLDYLTVSFEDKERLNMLYAIEQIGPSTYYAREKTKSFFEMLSELYLISNKEYPIINYQIKDVDYESIGSVQGDYSVSIFLRNFLYKTISNNESLSIFLPYSCTSFYEILRQLYFEQKGNIDICHLVLLDNNESSYEKNFDSLASILMFSFNSYSGYEAKYFYENLQNQPSRTVAFPYYIITNSMLVTISADYKSILYYANTDVIDSHRSHFNDLYQSAKLLVINDRVDGQNLTASISTLPSIEVLDFALESQPCFGVFLTPELVRKHLRKTCPNYDLVCKQLCELFGNYEKIIKKFVSFFIPFGVEEFLESGFCVNLPPKFATPFTMKERLKLVSEVKESILEQRNCTYKMINLDKFNYYPLFSIEFSMKYGLLLLTVLDNQFLTSHITNVNICEYIQDFMENLVVSDFVYSDEYTVAYLDKLLLKYGVGSETESITESD